MIGRRGLLLAAATSLVASLAAPAAGAEGKVTVLPCPAVKARFDHTRIDRTLKKEPKYGGRPAYRFFACGPDGKSVVAVVADESKGAGTGVDTVYVDLDADRDITEPGEKFSPKKPGKMNPKARGIKPGQVRVSFGWANKSVPLSRLKVDDPKFDYFLSNEGSFFYAEARLKDKSWWTHTRFGENMPWGLTRESAPVFRLGGDEWDMHNERFVSEKRRSAETDVGRTLVPGQNIRLDGTSPFFAGSTPVPGRRWVAGGHKNLRAKIQFLDAKDLPPVNMPMHES